MLILFIVLTCILLIAVVILTLLLIKFVKFAMSFEDNIGIALDVLDMNYANIDKLLDRPLLIDTPEVRYIMEQLHSARDSIITVATLITMQSPRVEDIEDTKDTEKDNET